jgi:hypothetical protein
MTAAPGQPPSRRAPSRQAQRSRSTRLRLLDATVECGWSGTSTTVVPGRAGASRSAQSHR